LLHVLFPKRSASVSSLQLVQESGQASLVTFRFFDVAARSAHHRGVRLPRTDAPPRRHEVRFHKFAVQQKASLIQGCAPRV
jgi:hypothetical protein